MKVHLREVQEKVREGEQRKHFPITVSIICLSTEDGGEYLDSMEYSKEWIGRGWFGRPN